MIRISDLPVRKFGVAVPEVYQLEVSSACNFSCPMCPRRLLPRRHPKAFIDLKLVEKLVAEKAFRGSYFVELQMSGEPTLHPQLFEIVSLLKQTGVMLGLSTNGSRILPDGSPLSEALLSLDYVTISVDSLLEDSTKIRPGRQSSFVYDTKSFIRSAHAIGHPQIDLQVVELPGWEEYMKAAKETYATELEAGYCKIRSVPDCFLTINDIPERLPVSTELCLNPWLSVSIQSNGNVTSCCFAFGDETILGNVSEQTLEEVWSDVEVQELRHEHLTQRYRSICARCYMRSPTLLHWEIFTSSLQGRKQ